MPPQPAAGAGGSEGEGAQQRERRQVLLAHLQELRREAAGIPRESLERELLGEASPPGA